MRERRLKYAVCDRSFLLRKVRLSPTASLLYTSWNQSFCRSPVPISMDEIRAAAEALCREGLNSAKKRPVGGG